MKKDRFELSFFITHGLMAALLIVWVPSFIVFAQESGLVFGKTDFSGNSIFSSKQLTGFLAYRPGDSFDEKKLQDSDDNVKAMYADKGHIHIELDSVKAVDTASNSVNIHWEILSEGPQVKIGDVRVETGNLILNAYLKKKVHIKAGDVFSVSRMRKSREALLKISGVESVQVDVIAPTGPNQIDMVFKVSGTITLDKKWQKKQSG